MCAETADNTIQQEKRQRPRTTLKIGELLVKEGFLKQRDIDQALAIQKREQEFLHLPIGKILIAMGRVKKADIERALQHPKLRKNIGALARDKGLISQESLDQVLQSRKPGQLIGEALVAHKLLARDDIGKLLEEQINSPQLGQLLVDLKIVGEKDVERALERQKKRTIGEILCERRLISPQDLNYVLTKYDKQIPTEEILLQLGYVEKNQLDAANKESLQKAEPIEQVLVKKKFITPEQLQYALAKKFNLPFLSLKDFTYTKKDKDDLAALIKQKYAEKNYILPLSLKEQTLNIAVCHSQQLILYSELKHLYPNLNISFVFITEEKFEELFNILYSRKLVSDFSGDQDDGAAEDMEFMEIDLDENMYEDAEKNIEYGAQDIEAEELVNFMVKFGIMNNASDIHIEQDRQGAKLRYRIDGVLQDPDIPWLKQKMQEKIGSIISRIKVMSNLDIAEKRLPQDGVFRINYFDKKANEAFDLDFRVATCSAIVGEIVVIRILDSRKASVGLDNLNHSPHVLTPFKQLLKSSAGMILVSGPTGSGKSSSLYGALKYLYNPGVKILTAEDPIEYSFPGIMQTQTNRKINLTFVRLLRSFLRLDPDIILVGEIRDDETAAIAFDAAQTGHMLLSTIHTNDSISAVSRMIDLDVEQSQIANCLLAVLAQRLLRKICPHCKKHYVPESDEWGLLFDEYPSHLSFYMGEGCDNCNYTGYKGRTLISEIFVLDKEISYAVSKGAGDAEIKRMALEGGMKTMLDDGLLKMEDTTLAELIRVIPHDMIKLFKARQRAGGKVVGLEEDSNTTNSGDKPAYVTPGSFIIADPASETKSIEKMFELYTRINEQCNGPSCGDISLFNDFIADNYKKICEQYECAKVLFTIDDTSGRADISALPEIG